MPPSALRVLLRAECAYIAFRHSAIPVAGNDFPVIGGRRLQSCDMLGDHSARSLRIIFSNTAADQRAPYQNGHSRDDEEALSPAGSTGENKPEEDESQPGTREKCPRCILLGSCVQDHGGSESRVGRDEQFVADGVSVRVCGRFPLHIEGSLEFLLMVGRVFRLGFARRIIAPRSHAGTAYLHGDGRLVGIVGGNVEAVTVGTGTGGAGGKVV